jgi:hypothetical protein
MVTLTDWDDRYYHVDQVLDRPGPRTDLDSFMAGDGIGHPISSFLPLSYSCTVTGQERLTGPVQDPRHRRSCDLPIWHFRDSRTCMS